MNAVARISSSGIVAVPAREDVRNLFPMAKRVVVDNVEHLYFDHDPASTFLLRSLGFTVPAPIMHYKWPGDVTPFDVQRRTAAMLVMNTRAYVLNGMGTGKTKSTLWAWDYLYSKKLTGKLIIFAPLSTLNVVWASEILRTIPHRKAVVLYGSRERREELLADRTADIYIINHDGHKVLADKLKVRMDITHVVIDELATYRNGTSPRAKAMAQFCARMLWVWGLTGSPMPTSPTDVWGQARIVTPATVPPVFTPFKDRLMLKVGNFKFVPKSDATDEAYKVLQPAVRFSLDDVTELPPLVERHVDVPMAPKQKLIYDKLVKEALALSERGDVITAANAGGIMSKLLQIACGWVYNSEGKIVDLANKARIDAVCDAIDGTDNKILVFASFKHATAGLSEALDARGYKHFVVTGDTPAKKRDLIFNEFQLNPMGRRIIVAHPQCLAHGVTLTAADTIVWFNPTTNLEIYEQANARIRRVGQKRKQLVLHFQGAKIEAHVYNMLFHKQNVQSKFLQLFKEGL